MLDWQSQLIIPLQRSLSLFSSSNSDPEIVPRRRHLSVDAASDQRRESRDRTRCIEDETQPREESANLSFAGCCFLGVYGLGVALAFRDLNVPLESCGGASIGSLTAAGLLSGCDLDRGLATTLEILEEVRQHPVSVLWNAKTRLSKFIDDHMAEDVDMDAMRGRFFVSVTSMPSFKNHLISEFRSVQHVKDTIMASCHIPGLMGAPRLVDFGIAKVIGVDGGFTNNMPSWHEKTITVSPFRFHHATIQPKDYIPVSYVLKPPSAEIIDDIFHRGWNDGEQYILDHF